MRKNSRKNSVPKAVGYFVIYRVVVTYGNYIDNYKFVSKAFACCSSFEVRIQIATAKIFQADVSSVSTSSERRTKG